MANPPLAAPPPSMPEAPLASVQPGGGWCMRLELAWGRMRRGLLRRFRPGYVAAMLAKRQGACEGCPHDIIDPRDLKFVRNVCGYSFKPEDDQFRSRERLGFARWGLAEIVIFTLIAWSLGAAIGVMAWAGAPPWLTAALWFVVFGLWLFILSFFRDPERTIPPDPTLLVSPADGKVTNLEEVDDATFPGGRALRISIFLSVFNVHVNRCPRAGRVTALRYFPGKYLNALKPLSAVENEQLWIDFTDAATGQPLRVKQIAGAIARRIVCGLRVGEEVKAGARFGMIKVGSRTEIFLPVGLAVERFIKVGDTVRGGSSPLLRLKPS